MAPFPHRLEPAHEVLTYRADIDGLRGIAVLAVLLFHAREAWLPGGYLGVDVFFVISGYLITGIALREQRQGRLRWRLFYERRARRLLPALITALAITTAAACVVMQAQERAAFGRSLLSTLGWVSNLYFWRTSNYFGEAAHNTLLLHTWSLAVEEQFYVVFPLLLALIAPRRGALPGLRIAVLLTLSVFLGLWAAKTHPNAAFFLLPFRAWELLAGAALAVVHTRAERPRQPLPLAHWIGVPALVCLLATLAFGEPGWGQLPDIVSNLIVVACSVALLHAGLISEGLQHRVLTIQPLVSLGLISYSLYLWHQPALGLMRLARGPELSVGLIGVALLGSLIMAGLSWRFVERPWRKVTPSNARLFGGVCLAGSLMLGCTGTWLHVNHGLGKPAVDWQREVLAIDFDARESQGIGRCFLLADQGPNEFGSCRMEGTGAGTALLWGDSHGAHLVPGFETNRAWFGELRQRNFSGCPGLLPATGDPANCFAARQFVMEEIRSAPPDHVLLAGRWAPGHEARLASTAAALRNVGVQTVTVLGPVPRWRGGLPGWLVGSIPRDASHKGSVVRLPRELPLPHAEAQAQLNALLRQASLDVGARYVDMLQLFCPHWPSCITSTDSSVAGVLAWDADHLTRAGSDFATARLSPFLRNSAAH